MKISNLSCFSTRQIIIFLGCVLLCKTNQTINYQPQMQKFTEIKDYLVFYKFLQQNIDSQWGDPSKMLVSMRHNLFIFCLHGCY